MMFGVKRVFFSRGRGRKSQCHRENVNLSLGRGFKALVGEVAVKDYFLGVKVRRVLGGAGGGGGVKVGFM